MEKWNYPIRENRIEMGAKIQPQAYWEVGTINLDPAWTDWLI